MLSLLGSEGLSELQILPLARDLYSERVWHAEKHWPHVSISNLETYWVHY